MKNLEEVIAAVCTITEALTLTSETNLQTELRLNALLICMAAVLRTLSSDPQVAASLAKNISGSAEAMHAVAMGHAVTDEFLAARNSMLRNLLPPDLQKLVQLPQ